MAGESRQVFISYARIDAQRVDALIEGLRQLHYDAWLDEELTGGQAWWDVVLSQIRTSSAVLVAVSPAALESAAVRREYEYAQAVGRPLLPVIVDTVPLETLPSLLAPLQVVDYRQPGTKNAFAVAAALAALPAPQALPRPLPDPPPIPRSYLSELKEQSEAATMSMGEQLVLVARLKAALGRAREREAAEEVLRSLQNRDDLYQASAREIESLLSPLNRQVPAPRSQDAPSPRPPGSEVGERDMKQTVEAPKSVQPGQEQPAAKPREGEQWALIPVAGPIVLVVPLLILAVKLLDPSNQLSKAWWVVVLCAAVLGCIVAAVNPGQPRIPMWTATLEFVFIWLAVYAIYKLNIGHIHRISSQYVPALTILAGVGAIFSVALWIRALIISARGRRARKRPVHPLLLVFLGCMTAAFCAAAIGYAGQRYNNVEALANIGPKSSAIGGVLILAALLTSLLAPLLALARRRQRPSGSSEP